MQNTSNIYTISAMLTDDALALKKEFIKKYPTSTYAIASEYYLGLINVSYADTNDKKSVK